MQFKSVYERALDKFGKEVQIRVCLEELGELISIVARSGRKHRKVDKQEIIEEMADVLICIETLRLIYGITETDLFSMKLRKLQHLEHYLMEGQDE